MRCPSCNAPNADAADVCIRCREPLYLLGRGTILARRYEIVEPLGKGGMGVVYEARDLQLDERVALKVLRADVAKAPQSARRFMSEIKLARKVRHRNTCAIHEYHEDGSLRFIVMELIQGVDLRKILRGQGALPPQEAYDVALQVARGLEAIHEAGIVHRDLKTSNLMRDARGVVRLMDFGIAKEYENQEATGLTAVGQIVGTPEYMSPEQAQGQRIDSRSDLYSLGVVVFELFTGDVPFRGATPVATLFKHAREPPPLDGPRAAALPPELVPILRKALAKDPAQRFATAKEMADALNAARHRISSEAMASRTEAVRPDAATATWTPSTQPPPQTEQDAGVPSAPTDWRTTVVPATTAARTQVGRSAVHPGLPWLLAVAIVAVALMLGLTGYAYLRLARSPASPPARPPLATSTPLAAATLPPAAAASPLVVASAPAQPGVRGGLAERGVGNAPGPSLRLPREDTTRVEAGAASERSRAAEVERLVISGRHALERASLSDDRGPYEEALRSFEQALALDPSDVAALSGRADARRRLDDLRTGSAAIVFVHGETTFAAPTSVTPRGFRDTPPGVEIRPAQASAPRAQLVIEATPSVIRRGDAYVLRYSLFNVSAAPLTIGAVSLRNSPAGSGPTGGSVEPQSRTARPQSRTLLCESRGTWGDDSPSDWATTLTVVLDDGSIYSSTLRAQRQ
jgi:serine/threonine-protein kinase